MSDTAGGSPLSQEDIDAVLPASEVPAVEADLGDASAGNDNPNAPQAVAAPVAATEPRDSAATIVGATPQPDDARPDPAAAPAGVAPLELPNLLDEGERSPDTRNIDLLRDVDLHVKIELGRTRMFVEDVLRLGPGSVVELDKLAGDPVDVLVNERLVARGEVLVLNDNFCVRINEILPAVEDVT
ncbi:MAG: flagellar motor switch protein FliN [Phycisphaerae bacterium]